MDEPADPLDRDHSLCVVLPGGLERKALVHGSKPVMDLLVTLCASYRLNPSDYTVEVLSPNKNNISFKPNSPIGSLEAEKIVLKPKGGEEKLRAPYMPEATVRLLINYNKSHKAVVRVNPRLPLEMLLPVVCDKCEFKVETTVLLRDCWSTEPLDMNKTLADHGLREVFARDTTAKGPEHLHHSAEQAVAPGEYMSPSPLEDVLKKEKKQKENTGFLSLFRRKKKKKNEPERAGSAATCPGLSKPVPAGQSDEQTLSSYDNLQGDAPKKRRAPQPPMGASLSVPNNLSTCHLRGTQTSADSTLRRTKRRAPPPPCATTRQEPQEDAQVAGTAGSLNALEESRESDESDSASPTASLSSSPRAPKLRSSSCSSRPTPARRVPSFAGTDTSDARCALATILTSSISNGILIRHLRHSAGKTELQDRSSFVSVTQECPDNGVGAERESVLTEPEWEDPVEKKGTATFKVVPSKKPQPSQDPELSLDPPDQCQRTGADETEPENYPTANEEDLCSPLTSESEAADEELQTPDSPDPASPRLSSAGQQCPASPLPEVGDAEKRQKTKEEDESEVPTEMTPAALGDPPSGQIGSDQSTVPPSPSKDLDFSGLDADDKEVKEEVVEEEEEEEEGQEDGFPPPPPPVFFSDVPEITEEQQEDTAPTASLSSPQPTSPACSRQIGDHPDQPSVATSAATPELPLQTSAAPSRFAQAVALAVQRSHLQNRGKALGQPPPSDPQAPHRSTYQHGA